MSAEDQNEQTAEESPEADEQQVDTENREEQVTDGSQPADQAEDQPTEESDQAGEPAEQVATAEGVQSDQPDVGTAAVTQDVVASADADTSAGDDEATTAEPAKAGSSSAPRKRLFRFFVNDDISALTLAPDSVRTAFGAVITDYAFAFVLTGAADGNPARMIEDGWERVPFDGIMDFPFSTVEKKQFFIGVAIIPNSKVDPKAASSQSLQRTDGVHTDDFEKMKATDAATLVKKFPDGVFILQINLLAQYIQIVVAGSTTFEAELSKAKIFPDDVVYNALSPFTDNSGKAIGTTHDVVYWASNLHLKGRKYVP